jgi:hypothetical protein
VTCRECRPPRDQVPMKTDQDQVATILVTIEHIMRDPAFALGAADVRAGLPFRRQYDLWGTNTQWCYERGRAWALLAPRHIKVHGRDGKLTPNAVAWFKRERSNIL